MGLTSETVTDADILKEAKETVITFEPFLEEVFVKADQDTIGLIDRNGFFFHLKKVNVLLSSDDLRKLAQKTDEVTQYGVDPPKCPDCGNTPYFPNWELREEKDDVTSCDLAPCPNEIHNRQFHHTGEWLR